MTGDEINAALASSGAHLILAPDGTILRAGPYFTEMTGYSSAEVEGLPVSEVCRMERSLTESLARVRDNGRYDKMLDSRVTVNKRAHLWSIINTAHMDDRGQIKFIDMRVEDRSDLLQIRSLRVRGVVAYLLLAACLFMGGGKVDQNSCIRSNGTRTALDAGSTLVHDQALRALALSKVDQGGARVVDLKAYADDLRAARQLYVPHLNCHLFFPSVR